MIVTTVLFGVSPLSSPRMNELLSVDFIAMLSQAVIE